VLVILLTVGGIPSIDAGDERAFRGIKQEREGGDDAIRPAFPDTPAALPEAGLGHYRLHQELIGLRRRHPWLVRARAEVCALNNSAMTYALADPAGGTGAGHRIVVALNLADQPVRLGLPAGSWRRIAGTEDFGADEVSLPPAGWAIAEE
jgi:hypothetical protein